MANNLHNRLPPDRSTRRGQFQQTFTFSYRTVGLASFPQFSSNAVEFNKKKFIAKATKQTL